MIEKGADVVVPICDADLGGPGARAANEKGILAITCAGAPGIGRQAIGPLTFNTYSGSPTESAVNAEYAYRKMGWRRAYFLCDRMAEYTKVVCEAFKTRWESLGGSSSARTPSSRPTSRLPRRSPGWPAARTPTSCCSAPTWGIARDQGDPRGLRRAAGALRRLLRHVLGQRDAAPVGRLDGRGGLQLRRRSSRADEPLLQGGTSTRPVKRRSSTRIRSSATPSSKRSRRASRSPARPTERNSGRRSRRSRTSRCSRGPRRTRRPAMSRSGARW